MVWRDTRIISRLGLRVPLFQSPMAGVQASDLAIAVARGGGVGAIPCALLSPDAVYDHVYRFRAATKTLSAPLNLNFFCHSMPIANATVKQWQNILKPYYDEYNVDISNRPTLGANRMPFNQESLVLVRELKPEIVSFHFGLPSPQMVQSVKDTGAMVLSTATTVQEAMWLEANGCDAVIAQGIEAGGHRGVFLPKQPNKALLKQQTRNRWITFPDQIGTMALIPQLVDAIKVPVIAAGGIGDARGVWSANVLGAAAVQMGTVFLLADETIISNLYRKALKRAAAGEIETVITNVFTGRPARGCVTRLVDELGPMCAAVPEFPLTGTALYPLKQAAEAQADTSFSSFWSGQSPAFAQEKSAEMIVRSMSQQFDALTLEFPVLRASRNMTT